MRLRAWRRFCSGSGPHDICTSATRNFSGGTASPGNNIASEQLSALSFQSVLNHELSKKVACYDLTRLATKARFSLGLPATSSSSCLVNSGEGAERRMASIAASACSDSVRTRSSRNSTAASCRVRAIADKRTDRNHGSDWASKDCRKRAKAWGERVPARASAASAAASSAPARNLPIPRNRAHAFDSQNAAITRAQNLRFIGCGAARRRSRSAADDEPICSMARATSARTDLSLSAKRSTR